MPPLEIDRLLQNAYGYHQAGYLAQAEPLYRKILDAHPGHEGALRMLYTLAVQDNRPDLAITYLTRATEVQPNNTAFLGTLGDLLLERKRLPEAAACYRQLLALAPDFVPAHTNLGAALFGQGMRDEAIVCYRRALALNPADAALHYNVGDALLSQMKTDEAIPFLLRALELKPDFADALNNLGSAHMDQNSADEAIACFRRVLHSEPHHVRALCNMGSVLHGQGKNEDAVVYLDEALRLQPNFGVAHMIRAMISLMRGDLVGGLREHEWRWNCELSPPRRHTFKEPRWDGRHLQGRTILLDWEQGYGDSIQFIRFAPLVAQMGGKVIFECPTALVRLFQNSLENVLVVDERLPLPPCDVQCPLLSLPLACGTTLETIPREVPYLKADAASIARWRTKLVGDDGLLKVGLTWAGHKDHTNDRERSMPVQTLAPLGPIPGVRFFSLQKGDRSLQALPPPAGLNVTDWTDELHDYADTAAFIANLDLVISVCTSVAHLAGAMGKPVWTLLSFVCDWRWLLDREDTPWYPTMRLFRQPAAGDWASVAERVAVALRHRAGESDRS